MSLNLQRSKQVQISVFRVMLTTLIQLITEECNIFTNIIVLVVVFGRNTNYNIRARKESRRHAHLRRVLAEFFME